MHKPDAKYEGRDGCARGHQQAFGQQLANETGAAGAQYQTNRNLLAAVRSTGQHHIGDIGASDQQDQPAQHQQEFFEKRHVLLSYRKDFAAAQELHPSTFFVFVGASP